MVLARNFLKCCATGWCLGAGTFKQTCIDLEINIFWECDSLTEGNWQHLLGDCLSSCSSSFSCQKFHLYPLWFSSQGKWSLNTNLKNRIRMTCCLLWKAWGGVFFFFPWQNTYIIGKRNHSILKKLRDIKHTNENERERKEGEREMEETKMQVAE